MVIFKKIASSLLLPPGVFIVFLTLSALWFMFGKSRKAAAVNILLAVMIWFLSISPVSDFMLRGLENAYRIPDDPAGDVIVLLGGGFYHRATGFSGTGSPSEDMAGRIIATVWLQKRLNLPVIVSGGKVFEERDAEAPVVKRLLAELGVPEGKIHTEEKSRDTIENARYTAELCRGLGFRKPVLVTSAYHMKRSVVSFRKAGMDVIPFPVAFKTGYDSKYGWHDYIPGASQLRDTSVGVKEYAGILFYRFVY